MDAAIPFRIPRFFPLCLLLCLGVSALGAGTATAAQTPTRVADINPGVAGSYASYVTPYAGSLYFRANDQPHGNNVELWKYDGTQTQKVAEIMPGLTGSDPTDLVVYNQRLYFTAWGPGGTALYGYDVAGGASVAAGYTAAAGMPQEMVSYGGNLVFRGSMSASGSELWTYNGSAIVPIAPAAGMSKLINPQQFKEYGGSLYFGAWGNDGAGEELYRLTGTTVQRVADIAPGANGSQPSSLAVYHNALYFAAYDGSAAEGGHGRELWKFDGSAATRVTDINTHDAYGSSNPGPLTVYKDALYFAATDGKPPDGGHGYELWKYDGNDATLVADINPTTVYFPGDDFEADSMPMWKCVLGDTLYFSADDGSNGRELWAYDGNDPWMVADIYPGQYGSDPQELTAYLGKLFFSADDGQFGAEPGVLRGGGLFMVAPEPATLALMGLGAAGLWAGRRRRRR